jgi:predicted phosphatase
MPRKKRLDLIPEEFASYEVAAEFWDAHDTTDYPEAFRTVEVTAELRKRHYEIEIDEEVIKLLRAQARRRGLTISQLATRLLRRQLVTDK